MSSTVNWAKLVAQGRAKAIGIPWEKEEELARKDGVGAEDIRTGKWKSEKKVPLLTPEQDENLDEILKLEVTPAAEELEEKIEQMKSLKRMKKDELIALAKEMKLEFDAEVVTRGDLILLIEEHRE